MTWAIYLGMSWTWCIGMFLPVLLIREFGFWGWVVFAVPNVIGAAAMGWIVSAADADAIARFHRPAVLRFSAVTIVFQIFFATWMALLLVDHGESMLDLATICLLVGTVCILHDRFVVNLSLIVFLVSVFCALRMHFGNVLSNAMDFVSAARQAPSKEIIPLLFVCMFGFGLCPYLDVTFLRVRRETQPQESRFAFGIGFGVFFLAMILLTLLYARPGESVLRSGHYGAWLPAVLIGYWVVQLSYTVMAHLSEIKKITEMKERKPLALIGLLFLVVSVGTMLFFPYLIAVSGELIYLLFMSFYALIFPAYVWLCMIPTRGRARPSKQSLIVLAIACAVASPMYWMGFIEKRMMWLIPGVGIALLARLLIKTTPDLSPRLDLQQNSAPIS